MKTVLITGATSGIGRATARILASRGYRLALAARTADRLKTLAAEIGGEVICVPTDVCKYQEVQELVERTVTHFGTIDVLINNAGVGYFEHLVDASIDQWTRMVDVNIKGVLHCLHTTLPHLIKSRGMVINISSVAGRQVFSNSGVYCATKHAVHAISESLRLELADKIRITTISPGAVNTDFVHSTTSEEMLKEYVPYFASAMDPAFVALEILRAIECAPEVVLSEIIIRPNRKNK